MTEQNDPEQGPVARALLELRQEVAKLSARVEELPDAGTIRTLAEDLAGVAARLGEVELQLEDPGTGKLWDWEALFAEWQSEKSQKAIAMLREWVERVLKRMYGVVGWPDLILGKGEVRPIPECWDLHPDLIVELGWLCQEWIKIYKTSYGTPARAGDWHDRYLPGLRRRLPTSTAAQCTDEDSSTRHHQPRA